MRDHLFKKVELIPSLPPHTTTSAPPTVPPNPAGQDPSTRGRAKPRGRGRGRPFGSRNKPKPPVIITQPSMHPMILEIAAGQDIVDSLWSISATTGLHVLDASGRVRNVSLRQPCGSAVTFEGVFDIVSLCFTRVSRTVFLPVCSVTLGGLEVGQLFGGPVVGQLVADGPVSIVATTVANWTYQCVPEEAERVPDSNSAEVDVVGPVGPEKEAAAVTDSDATPSINSDHLFF